MFVKVVVLCVFNFGIKFIFDVVCKVGCMNGKVLYFVF